MTRRPTTREECLLAATRGKPEHNNKDPVQPKANTEIKSFFRKDRLLVYIELEGKQGEETLTEMPKAPLVLELCKVSCPTDMTLNLHLVTGVLPGFPCVTEGPV